MAGSAEVVGKEKERTTRSPRAAGSTPERSTTAFSTAVSSTSGAVSLNAPRFALQMGVRTCRGVVCRRAPAAASVRSRTPSMPLTPRTRRTPSKHAP